MIDQQKRDAANYILRLHQRTNRDDLLQRLQELPDSVGIEWESVGNATFLIVPGFCTVNENGVQSEFPMPLRVVLDDTDAPMALLRMWATRTLEDEQEESEPEPEAKQPAKKRHNWSKISEAAALQIRDDATRLNRSCEEWAKALNVPRGTFSNSQTWKDIQYQQKVDKDAQEEARIERIP